MVLAMPPTSIVAPTASSAAPNARRQKASRIIVTGGAPAAPSDGASSLPSNAR
jgi:hypothetical protein